MVMKTLLRTVWDVGLVSGGRVGRGDEPLCVWFVVLKVWCLGEFYGIHRSVKYMGTTT